MRIWPVILIFLFWGCSQTGSDVSDIVSAAPNADQGNERELTPETEEKDRDPEIVIPTPSPVKKQRCSDSNPASSLKYNKNSNCLSDEKSRPTQIAIAPRELGKDEAQPSLQQVTVNRVENFRTCDIRAIEEPLYREGPAPRLKTDQVTSNMVFLQTDLGFGTTLTSQEFLRPLTSTQEIILESRLEFFAEKFLIDKENPAVVIRLDRNEFPISEWGRLAMNSSSHVNFSDIMEAYKARLDLVKAHLPDDVEIIIEGALTVSEDTPIGTLKAQILGLMQAYQKGVFEGVDGLSLKLETQMEQTEEKKVLNIQEKVQMLLSKWNKLPTQKPFWAIQYPFSEEDPYQAYAYRYLGPEVAKTLMDQLKGQKSPLQYWTYLEGQSAQFLHFMDQVKPQEICAVSQ